MENRIPPHTPDVLPRNVSDKNRVEVEDDRDAPSDVKSTRKRDTKTEEGSKSDDNEQ